MHIPHIKAISSITHPSAVDALNVPFEGSVKSFPPDLHVLACRQRLIWAMIKPLQFKILWLNEYWLQNQYLPK